jgi:hypothetical protein
MRAEGRLAPWPELPRALGLSALTFSRSKEVPELWAWVKENQPSQELGEPDNRMRQSAKREITQ